ncbi:MAG: hypothetical protein J6S67_04860 [Methanobrevibacter sp.]|nr:hypothetical protein [Methanobrevibacter sp.]
MTVDEIEKEARKWILNNWEKYDFIECDDSEMDDMFNRAVMDDIVLACVAVAVPREKMITELEKENTELKEAIKHFNPCSEWNDDVHDCEFRHYAMEYGSKLTKAKEIIKELLKSLDGRSGFNEDVFKQAEQFLEETE